MVEDMPTLFRILYCCGLRPGEVLHLEVGDVDLKKGVLLSRAVFAAHIVGTVAKAAVDASASARLMTGWRHHLHLYGEQGCELHKVSRQIIPLLSGNKKGPESYC